ncbi:MAG: formyltetrahydrofolate deformylase [Phycisphaerales bacterium]|nr:formyltetrahydrofolate deformylase [Phycisphaerales bacterium]
MTTYTLVYQAEQHYGIQPYLLQLILDKDSTIISFQEYAEPCNYFCRVQWTSKQSFSIEDFKTVDEQHKGIGFLKDYDQERKLLMFTSKNIVVPLEILSKVASKTFPNTKIIGIIGNTDTFKQYADKFEIPFYHTPTNERSVEDYEADQLSIVKKLAPDFICLARYMKVVSAHFLEQVNCKVINIHHSFLPSFIGANPYEEAFNRGVKIVGATSHFVTPELDEGPIIEQNVVRVRNGFSIQDIKKIGVDVEKQTLSEALRKVLEYKVCIGFCKKRTIIFD